MNHTVIDEVDLRILRCLVEDASRPHKDIGQDVHLTGQAVGARIRKMQDAGLIEGYTVRWNPEKIGPSVLAFVTVYLKPHTNHRLFYKFAMQNDYIVEMHRISGEGCVWMRVRADTQENLTLFLDDLLLYGVYNVTLSIGKLK